MHDGEHEGHSGHRIDQILNDLDLSKASKPNIYLINAGTNDCQQNYLNMEGTIDRLTDILNKAWEASPKAAIILSTVLTSDNEKQSPGANGRVNQLNPQIRQCKSGFGLVMRLICCYEKHVLLLTTQHSGKGTEEGW
jgi:hypothetical protein